MAATLTIICEENVVALVFEECKIIWKPCKDCYLASTVPAITNKPLAFNLKLTINSLRLYTTNLTEREPYYSNIS
jgi:hypothetical protein